MESYYEENQQVSTEKSETPKSPLKYSASYTMNSPGKSYSMVHNKTGNRMENYEKYNSNEEMKLELEDDTVYGNKKENDCPTPEKCDIIEQNQSIVENERTMPCNSPSRRRSLTYPIPTVLPPAVPSQILENDYRLLSRKTHNAKLRQELDDTLGGCYEITIDACEDDEEKQDDELLAIKRSNQNQKNLSIWNDMTESIDACEDDPEEEDTHLIEIKWKNALKKQEHESMLNERNTYIDACEEDMEEHANALLQRKYRRFQMEKEGWTPEEHILTYNSEDGQNFYSGGDAIVSVQ